MKDLQLAGIDEGYLDVTDEWPNVIGNGFTGG